MVTLQKPSLRHADAFLQSVRRSRKLHKGFVCPPADQDGYRRYVNALRSERRESFLVVIEGTDELVGVVNVNEIVRGAFQSAYLGYYAFTPHAGHGLMRQGMHKVISYCFGELKLHRLEANIQPDNKRSISLVTGLGFRNEGFSPRYLKVCGRWRDHERWALLSEDWRRRARLAQKANQLFYLSKESLKRRQMDALWQAKEGYFSEVIGESARTVFYRLFEKS